MPAYTRGVGRELLTFVKVKNPSLFYGWKTKDLSNIAGINAADLAALGHILPASLAAGSKGFLGANAPKPARYKKTINRFAAADSQASVSTFCGIGAGATALANGWEMAKPPNGINFSNGRSITVALRLTNDLYYCYPVNATDVSSYGTELGFILPQNLTDVERNKCFRGATRPRPPRVKKKVGARGDITKFCSADKLDDVLSTGWQLVKGEIPFDIATA